MQRTTATLALAGLAIGIFGAGAALALSDSGTTQAVAPISVSAVSDGTLDPTLNPTAGPTDASAAPTSDPGSTSTGPSTDDSTSSSSGTAVAVPEGITVDAARQIALRVKPGSVREVELEDEADRTVWKVDINGRDGVRWEVYVDAITGTVVETDRH